MWRERLTSDPHVAHGQVCVRGTRIPASVVLDNLAAGLEIDAIVTSYPPLTRTDVLACIAYAADIAREHVVPLDPAA